jgi:hypothetical protein
MTDTTQASAPSSSPQFVRTDEFSYHYANSIVYESTAWDLKIIFGQFEQTSFNPPTGVVKQRLAVTVPWPQAKLALFWLRVQVEAAELAVNAKIPIRPDLLPAELPALTAEEEKDPRAPEFHELYRRLREEFLASL